MFDWIGLSFVQFTTTPNSIPDGSPHSFETPTIRTNTTNKVLTVV